MAGRIAARAQLAREQMLTTASADDGEEPLPVKVFDVRRLVPELSISREMRRGTHVHTHTSTRAHTRCADVRAERAPRALPLPVSNVTIATAHAHMNNNYPNGITRLGRVTD